MQKLEDLDVSLDAYPIDASVKHILNLFPRQTAKELLVALLRTAHTQLQQPGGQAIAVVPTGGSLTHVARSIGMSKDTFLRYTAVLHGIGLLYYIHDELRFPLGPYQPTEAAIHHLDQLIASEPRRKLQTLATGVRDRYQVAFGFVAVPVGTQNETRALLQDAQARLQKNRLSQIDRQMLGLQIDRLIAFQDGLEAVTQQTGSTLSERAQHKGDRSDLPETARRQVTLVSERQGSRQYNSSAEKGDLTGHPPSNIEFHSSLEKERHLDLEKPPIKA